MVGILLETRVTTITRAFIVTKVTYDVQGIL